MLLTFDIGHFNWLAYATIIPGTPPIASTTELERFLESAREPYARFNELPNQDEANQGIYRAFADSSEVAQTHLRQYMSGPNIYLGRSQTAAILASFHEHSQSSDRPPVSLAIVYKDALDTIPRSAVKHLLSHNQRMWCFLLRSSSEVAEILDPLPPVDLLRDVSVPFPHFVFWSDRGASCILPPALGMDIYNFIHDAGYDIDRIDQIISDHSSRRLRSRSLLHLSDLHFGRLEAAENEAYLLGHLEEIIPKIDQIIVTGDLSDSPKRRNIATFNNFRRRVERLLKKDLVVIPGNHDQRPLGNALGRLGRRLKFVAELEWRNIVVDDGLRSIFFCFDSSREGNFARGRLASRDLLAAATEFEAKRRSRPEIDEYFRIALVHHHPFSYQTEPPGLLQSFLSKFSPSDDTYSRLDGADEFIEWCHHREIRLILHGHKHVPRHFVNRGGLNDVSAIGCGTTMGIDKLPLSYDIVSFDPTNKRYAVAFYNDKGDGRGFEEQGIAIKFV